MEEKKIDGYIPDGNLATKMKGNKRNDNLYSKDKFEYDEERDCFICPRGDVLVRKGEYKYNGKVQYHYYGANCGECPSRADCVGDGKMRSITSDVYEAQRRRMMDKMKSEQGKEAYKKRKRLMILIKLTDFSYSSKYHIHVFCIQKESHPYPQQHLFRQHRHVHHLYLDNFR